MSTPVEKLDQSIGHACQTGCGNMAAVVLVQLATGECDVMCQPCLVAMMTAVIQQVVDGMPDSELEAVDPVAVAAEAAARALAETS